MANTDSGFQLTGEGPEAYERYMVPIHCMALAEDLIDRVRLRPREQVLDVACGTGIVSRYAAQRVGTLGHVTGVELNPAMIEVARHVSAYHEPVEYLEGDASALPVPDAGFDVTLCQHAIMFFPDRVSAYREIRRVLRSGGTFLFNVWSEIEDNEFANVITDALSVLYPEDPPKFLARAPYGHGCPAKIESDVRAAGFEAFALDERSDVSAAASPDIPAIAFCQGTPLRNEIESLEPGGLERATAAATEALRTQYGSGPIEGRISAVVVSAS